MDRRATEKVVIQNGQMHLTVLGSTDLKAQHENEHLTPALSPFGSADSAKRGEGETPPAAWRIRAVGQSKGSTTSMKRYEFRLNISSEAYLDYYRGVARAVVARCVTGQTVQFPASLLQGFVTTEGIHGRFVLTCDENNKCIGLQRVEVRDA